MAQKIHFSQKKDIDTIIAADVETTSLSSETGSIIEIGAVKLTGGIFKDEWNRLISIEQPLEKRITELTGISDEMLAKEGIPLKTALIEFIEFIGNDPLIFHNTMFDMSFLRRACQICGLPQMKNRTIDTLALAKKKLRTLSDYRLETIAEHFGIEIIQRHRALSDCRMAAQLYDKLKKI